MIQLSRRTLLIAGIVVVACTLVVLGTWVLHDRYHARANAAGHIVVCQNGTLPVLERSPLAGCQTTLCLEVLPSGQLTRWYFARC